MRYLVEVTPTPWNPGKGQALGEFATLKEAYQAGIPHVGTGSVATSVQVFDRQRKNACVMLSETFEEFSARCVDLQ